LLLLCVLFRLLLPGNSKAPCNALNRHGKKLLKVGDSAPEVFFLLLLQQGTAGFVGGFEAAFAEQEKRQCRWSLRSNRDYILPHLSYRLSTTSAT
jgi:hypothetical protein